MGQPVPQLRTQLRELRSLLSSQVVPDGQYVSQPIPGIGRARLAMGAKSLALIINYVPQGRKYDKDLKNLLIQFDRTVSIIGGKGAVIERVAILETKGLDIALQDSFLEVISLILPSFETADDQDIVRLINHLVEVFQFLGSQSKKTALGLWGELFVIWRALDPEGATKSWHSSISERYDFGAENQRIEVKTTTGPRSHFFSFEQLAPSPHLNVCVCSIITNADDSNTSCLFLLNEILKLLDSQSAKQHITKTAIATLGGNWPSESTISFDLDSAIQSIRWFKTDVIPKVAELPAGVSQVKFKSDLQNSPDTPIDSLAVDLGLFAVLSDRTSIII
jgi:hypothetical protein